MASTLLNEQSTLAVLYSQMPELELQEIVRYNQPHHYGMGLGRHWTQQRLGRLRVDNMEEKATAPFGESEMNPQDAAGSLPGCQWY